MSQFRMSAPAWALVAVSSLFLVETMLVLFPGQSTENQPSRNTPITIKFSCPEGSGQMRLDVPRNADPNLVQSVNLRSDLKMWLPRGAELRYEENPTKDEVAR